MLTGFKQPEVGVERTDSVVDIYVPKNSFLYLELKLIKNIEFQ